MPRILSHRRLHHLKKNAPDILLLDLVIGNDVSIEIADLAGYRLPNAEVIYLTGSKRFPNGELLGLSKNASWILRKPIDFFELQAMISHIERTMLARNIDPVSPVWSAKSAG